MKHIIFCADDYGQNATISQAIIDLLRKNRLSATSCLTTFNDWLVQAKNLEPLKNQVDIGLHFNLTEGKPLSGFRNQFLPLSQLLFRAFLRYLNPVHIENELNAQIDQYIAGMGQLPDFIDGHQHIHQFPVIRDVFLKVYEQRLRAHGTYVRCVHDSDIWLRFNKSGYIKRWIIELTGGFAFKKALIKHHIPHNTSFSGMYDFKNSRAYSDIFPQFLAEVKEGGLIMCHPGETNRDKNDLIGHVRFQEYDYFLGEEFIQACQTQGVQMSRFIRK